MSIESGSTDSLRFDVQPAGPDAGGGFELQIFVNEVEMTSKGAGLGMDPYDVLVPVSRFLPGTVPHQVAAARCGCGVYGCGVTDLLIKPEPEKDRVVWEWLVERPLKEHPVFGWSDYLAECTRIGSDTSWETPERTTGRLILSDPRLQAIDEHGLTPDWVGNRYDDDEYFEVCLRLGTTHQIFITFAWDDRAPKELADEVVTTLMSDPAEWLAEWHSIQPDGGEPDVGARRWSRRRL